MSDTDRPTVPDVLLITNALYARPGGGAGCCLHLVLDDNNLSDGDVEYCLHLARDRGHTDCLALGLLLLQMKRAARGRVAAKHD